MFIYLHYVITLNWSTKPYHQHIIKKFSHTYFFFSGINKVIKKICTIQHINYSRHGISSREQNSILNKLLHK